MGQPNDDSFKVGKYKFRPKPVKKKRRKKKKENDPIKKETFFDPSSKRTIQCFIKNDSILVKKVATETKKVFNSFLFNWQFFDNVKKYLLFDAICYHNRNTKNNNICNINNYIHDQLFHYYRIYQDNYAVIKNNNNVIYTYIKSLKLNVYNYNFYSIYNELILKCAFLKDVIYTPEYADITFQDIIFKILKSFYLRNFYKTKYEMLNHIPLTIKNTDFISHVKEGNSLFQDTDVNNLKIILSENITYKLDSDQNIIKKFSRDIWYFNNKKNNILSQEIISATIDKAYDALQSYYALRKAGKYANQPKYLKDTDLYNIILKGKNDKKIIKNTNKSMAKMRLTLAIDKNKDNYLYLRIPKRLKNKKITQVDIIPDNLCGTIKVSFTYDKVIPKIKHKKAQVSDSISIDLGMKNIATIYDPTGKQYLIRGGKIVGINEYYNKVISEEQTKLALKKEYTSEKLRNLWIKREQELDKEIIKLVKTLDEMYKDKKNIIIGYNEGWKQHINLGRNVNRKFVQVPYTKIIKRMREYMWDKNIILNEESYTSLCDALSLESVERHNIYLGKRRERGLFESATGKLINADLNGAINIMRKVITLNNIEGNGLYNPIKITL
jgi:IS605 OrfB family transposase